VNRGQAAAERRDRQATQAFDALQTLDAQGLPADPAFLTDTLGKLKGTPYEEAARQIVNGSAATAQFGALPVAQQDAVLADEYAKAREKGVTPATSARLKKLEGIRSASERAYKEDRGRRRSSAGRSTRRRRWICRAPTLQWRA